MINGATYEISEFLVLEQLCEMLAEGFASASSRSRTDACGFMHDEIKESSIDGACTSSVFPSKALYGAEPFERGVYSSLPGGV